MKLEVMLKVLLMKLTHQPLHLFLKHQIIITVLRHLPALILLPIQMEKQEYASN